MAARCCRECDQSVATMMVRGHYAYYGISGNIKRLRQYAYLLTAASGLNEAHTRTF